MNSHHLKGGNEEHHLQLFLRHVQHPIHLPPHPARKDKAAVLVFLHFEVGHVFQLVKNRSISGPGKGHELLKKLQTVFTNKLLGWRESFLTPAENLKFTHKFN